MSRISSIKSRKCVIAEIVKILVIMSKNVEFVNLSKTFGVEIKTQRWKT